MIRPETICRHNVLRGLALPAVLAVLLSLALALSACGGKKELGTAPAPVATPAVAPDASARQSGELSGQQPGPLAEAPAVAADEADARLTAPTQTGDSAPAKADAAPKTAPAVKATPVRQMLQSAGRDPDAVQPEPGFLLDVPDAAGDGEPFAVSFTASGAESVTLSWRGKTLSVAGRPEAPGVFTALLAVPLDEKSKSFPLTMSVAWTGGAKETFTADLPVKKRQYPVQRLKVDSKYVTPPADVQDKIKRDRAEMRAAVGKVTPHRYWTLPMQRPVPGEVTSLYGMRRVFNGKPKNPHKGVDYDAKQGDPIASMEDGVVVLVSEHYYGGNTVVVDHGLGVMSAYLHLSGFNVAEGQSVKRGETIGFIGSTGRVTGPHLHLSLYVMGESVNAATCLNR